eukprot:gene4756-6668_t
MSINSWKLNVKNSNSKKSKSVPLANREKTQKNEQRSAFCSFIWCQNDVNDNTTDINRIDSKEDISHPYNNKLMSKRKQYFLSTGSNIEAFEGRGITIRQLRFILDDINIRCKYEKWKRKVPTFFGLYSSELLTPENVTINDIHEYVIKFYTGIITSRRCCYVELVANSIQCPLWYVIYNSDTSFQYLLQCLEEHAKNHNLSIDTPYWIHAFAMNPWTLDSEDHQSVDNSLSGSSNSLFKSKLLCERIMELCVGSVTVIDTECKLFSRIWCNFEFIHSINHQNSLILGNHNNNTFENNSSTNNNSIMTTKSYYFIEMYTCDDKNAIGITDGLIESDNKKYDRKYTREMDFPLEQLTQLIDSIIISTSKAMLDSDTKIIKNILENYNKANSNNDNDNNTDMIDYNNIIRGKLVSMAWMRLFKSNINLNNYYSILQLSNISRMERLYFTGMKYFDDEAAKRLVLSLPHTLRFFELSLDRCGITANGLNYIYNLPMILPCLESLKIFYCRYGKDSISSLINSLKSPQCQLKTLYCIGNGFDAKCGNLIALALQGNKIIHNLNLRENNQLNDPKNVDIFSDLQNNRLLDISNNIAQNELFITF